MTTPRPFTLGDVLVRADEPATLVPDAEYDEITIKLWGKGVVSRGKVRGGDVVASRRFVRAGQFILSKIDARNGAIGIIPPELDGAIVSNDFPSFAIRDTNLTNSAFLGWMARSPGFIGLCKAASEGTTNRIRIKESKFFRQEVLLPSPTEQRAILTHLDGLADKTRQLIDYLDAVEADADRCLANLASRPDLTDAEHLARGWTQGCLGDVLRPSGEPVSVQADKEYPNVGVLSYARGLFTKPSISGATTSAKTLFRIRQRQFIYSRLFAFEGAYALVMEEHDGAFVSNEFPAFDIEPELASPQFLYAYFRSPHVWEAIAQSSKGLGDRRQRVQPAQLLGHRLWLPPRRQLELLGNVVPSIVALKARHVALRKACAALVPATLERLFARQFG